VAARKKTPLKNPSPKKKRPAGKFSWKLILAGFILVLLSPLYYGYVLKTFVSVWRWARDIGANPNYRTYTSFHIRIPTKYSIHGIDVSYAQGRINWPRVKAMQEDSVRISFAFIKATEGLLKVDPYFKRNWREAPKAGIICGAYHFLRADKNGAWQARFFLQNVTTEAGDMPPVVDVETLDSKTPEEMRKQLQSFLTYIQVHAKLRPIIYTQLSFYADYLAGYFNGYSLWIAHYNQPDLQTNSGLNWQFWQHSDAASISGIGHSVDFDAFRGDSVAFGNLLVR
jgi:lysozyme